MRYIYILLVVFTSISFAQVKGVVKDADGKPVHNVNIYVKEHNINTTTNENGFYYLPISKNGNYTISYQYIGYKTNIEKVNYTGNTTIIDVTMLPEEYQLESVVVKKGYNPANDIIKNAIAKRKENGKKSEKYTADFYSRGIFRVKDLPEKFMGQKVDMFDEIIDSTRSGILYLSETVSKITAQKPDKMKEVIVASKVSGRDNGYSFNTAASVDFDFYTNYIDMDRAMISPIADNAFNYYKYKLDGSFTDENNFFVYKIKVSPKRDTEPVFSGYIYIVDNTYAIQGLELETTGKQMGNDGLNKLVLKQNFSYNSQTKVWTKNIQAIDFDAGIFTFKFNGNFTHVYSNYNFPEKFEKKTFTAEVLKFEENSNKKDDSYWQTMRPVPLTTEETNDYLKKDALQLKKKSKVYLDSIDAKHNKFKIGDILSGYSYKNTYKKWSLNYESPITSISFNTVQGWKGNLGISYTKTNEAKKTFTSIATKLDYGFSEKKFRPSFRFYKKLNAITHDYISVSGGSKVNQFNSSNPISDIVNTVSTLFFKNNFQKLYEQNFVHAAYGREVVNGLYLNVATMYAERKPLFNHTDYSVIKSDDLYTSNNPWLPYNETIPAFEKYNLAKATFSADIKIGQKYITRPDARYTRSDSRYPKITLAYEQGFAANKSQYNFGHFSGIISHSFDLKNKGILDIKTNAGTFINAKNIAFPDFKHFNGNQTHISNGGSYLNVFHLMPYYAFSTNDKYIQLHAEHNDNGFIMNKIPLLNKLQSQLVIGFHTLAQPNMKPYQEVSVGLDNLGFGKFKMFRIDYVRSYQSGFKTDGVMFGLKFLDIVE